MSRKGLKSRRDRHLVLNEMFTDEDEKRDIEVIAVATDSTVAKAKLQGALDQFKGARRAELDQQFLISGTGKDKPGKKGKSRTWWGRSENVNVKRQTRRLSPASHC